MLLITYNTKKTWI